MGSLLPTKVEKSPIVSSNAEVRLGPGLAGPTFFASMYAELQTNYPTVEQLPIANIPINLTLTDPNLAYLPHYRLVSTDGMSSILLGPRVLNFSCEPYISAEIITSSLSAVLRCFIAHRSKHPVTIEKIGLRYINFFEGIDIRPNSTVTLQMNGEDIVSNNTNLRVEIPEDDFVATISLMSHAKVARQPDMVNFVQLQAGQTVNVAMPQASESKEGSVIDIDLSANLLLLNDDPDLKRLNFLFKCAHDYAKKRFFSLLTDDFIETLGPSE